MRNSVARFMLLILAAPASHLAAQTSDSILDFIDGRYEDTAQLARTIWEFAEVGYQETRSSALLQQTLDEEGAANHALTRIAERAVNYLAIVKA